MEQGLHDLIAAGLARPVAVSSIGGQREFVFWHALTQEVAYHQVPRDLRAASHERVAEWFERACGERAEDFAEMLAHHYVRALELRGALHDDDAAARLTTPAVRYLQLAASRALVLDVAAAERLAKQAVRLAKAGTVAHGQALSAWGEALIQAGRMREASDALTASLAELLEADYKRQAARTMANLWYVRWLLGEVAEGGTAEDALAMLKGESPSIELVDVMVQCASEAANRCRAQRVLELSEQIDQANELLGLPQSTRALEFRGLAHALLGEKRSLDDYAQAFDLAKGRRLGKEACSLGANWAESLLLFSGPAAALERLQTTYDTACHRGDEFAQAYCRELIFTSLLWLGKWQEAVREARDLDDLLAAQADQWDLQLLRGTHALLLVLLGRPNEARPLAEWAEESSRTSPLPATRASCLISRATVCEALGEQARAHDLLVECDRLPHDTRGNPDFVQRLPHAIRLAFSVGDAGLALSLADGVPAGSRFAACSLRAADGLDALEDGRLEMAIASLEEATAGWKALGLPDEDRPVPPFPCEGPDGAGTSRGSDEHGRSRAPVIRRARCGAGRSRSAAAHLADVGRRSALTAALSDVPAIGQRQAEIATTRAHHHLSGDQAPEGLVELVLADTTCRQRVCRASEIATATDVLASRKQRGIQFA